jgi:hypothetical protein
MYYFELPGENSQMLVFFSAKIICQKTSVHRENNTIPETVNNPSSTEAHATD